MRVVLHGITYILQYTCYFIYYFMSDKLSMVRVRSSQFAVRCFLFAAVCSLSIYCAAIAWQSYGLIVESDDRSIAGFTIVFVVGLMAGSIATITASIATIIATTATITTIAAVIANIVVIKVVTDIATIVAVSIVTIVAIIVAVVVTIIDTSVAAIVAPFGQPTCR